MKEKNSVSIFPITSSISVIWKHQTHATSHAPAEAFPITPCYRKYDHYGYPLKAVGLDMASASVQGPSIAVRGNGVGEDSA